MIGLKLLCLLAVVTVGGANAQSMEQRTADADAAAASPARASAEPSPASERVLQLSNVFRRSQGREPVVWSPKLAATAQDFAQFMARTDRYGHHADDRKPSERARAHGYEYCLIAENIAYQYRTSGFSDEALAEALVDGWKHSPPHRRNMLDPDVAESGVAVAQSNQTQRWYAVQLFGLPESAQISFQISNLAGASVRYSLDELSFELQPRVVRTHERCRPAQMTLHWPGGQPPTSITPRDSGRYRVVQTPSGRWRLEGQ